MDFHIEKTVSNFIENQFPDFYKEDGQNFILFMKAYYEWMESEGQAVYESRELFDYRDIDNTIEPFLEFFQKKYLYGIPFNVITSKRFLLKHILDVYRSKGSIQCYRLLFKLIYDEDVEIYLPGRDIIKASDGIWIEPKYLELSDNGNLDDFVGKTIVGVSSETTAIVENYIRESYNKNKINVLYITNVAPFGGDFEIGEIVALQDQLSNTAALATAPLVLGSLDYLDIINGGQNFKIGDILKIAYKSPKTGQIISSGIEGLIRITKLIRGTGSLSFNVIDGGLGFTTNSQVYVYNNINDTTGSNAGFSVFSLSSTRNIEYNTDLICDYRDTVLNAASFSFPKQSSANVTSNTLTNILSYSNNTFGKIVALSNISTGNGYTNPANVFVRSTLESKALTGNVEYVKTHKKVFGADYTGTATGYNNTDVITVVNGDGGTNATITMTTNNTGGNLVLSVSNYGNAFVNTSSTVLVKNASGGSSTGTGASFKIYYTNYVIGTNGTLFDTLFTNNSVISLFANNTTAPRNTVMIRQVVNSSLIFLYGPPSINSYSTAQYRVCPTLFPASFAPYQSVMYNTEGTINGQNEVVAAIPSTGNNVVGAVNLVNSGKGYTDGETVSAYLFGAVSNTVIIDLPGSGYQIGDSVIFSGGDPGTPASGVVTSVDSNGGITAIQLSYAGSGYTNIPEIRVRSATGSGASLSTSLEQFNTQSEVTGRVVKRGIGKGRGSYATTRGFLNSNKYIQDSYYYQDFSYEIQVAQTLDKYKDILYNTFHSTGSELFGKYFLYNQSNSYIEVLSEPTAANTTAESIYFLASSTKLLASSSQTLSTLQI